MISIQELVRKDLIWREQEGIRRYGTPLQPFNGREALLDAYEEVLDLCVYLRQFIEEFSVSLKLPHVDVVSLSADDAPAASDVHASAAVLGDLTPGPASDCIEHQVDLSRTPYAHERANPVQEWDDSVNTRVRPGPGCLPVILLGLSASDIPAAYEFVQSGNGVKIGHCADDADQRSRSSVFILAASEIEAPLAFEKTANPAQVNILHDPQCSSGRSCAALKVAITVQRILRVGLGQNKSAGGQEYA